MHKFLLDQTKLTKMLDALVFCCLTSKWLEQFFQKEGQKGKNDQDSQGSHTIVAAIKVTLKTCIVFTEHRIPKKKYGRSTKITRHVLKSFGNRMQSRDEKVGSIP